MKMRTTKKLFATLLIAFSTTGVFAQTQERTYTLNPKEIPPQSQGYFLTGVEKDGVIHKGCGAGTDQNVTEHSGSIHNENGSSGGWTFKNVSIMAPDCNGKGTPDADVPTGYLQLRENTNWAGYVANPNDPAIVFGSLTSLPVTDIKSLTIQAGSDLSTLPNNPNRTIVFGIEVSTDGGVTWEGYTTKTLEQQGGRTYRFVANGDDQGFNLLATLSQTQPVMVRIIPWLNNEGRGQRIKVFGLSMTATGPAVTSLKAELAGNEPFFEIENNVFVATNNKGNLSVYNLTGALVGKGSEVAIPGKGLYIVRSDKGLSRKIFLQ
ncbi:hypothetical protein [Botryobacter ruber]|uniref:hypothetical protein n=1 Tax=Botryobacter ruber TaxID=2171629 RepID=UPI000F651ED5|nr:hypothetical protein [Botryobacter ruber]